MDLLWNYRGHNTDLFRLLSIYYGLTMDLLMTCFGFTACSLLIDNVFINADCLFITDLLTDRITIDLLLIYYGCTYDLLTMYY